ncbi:hypothetical protein MES5069_510016 [Mesorhizobium escarrei]|uniref:Uncharacterized protein n=1 Tax=Mesorhizobium escarrei TaxID=666018 RepID=A0ABM9EA88_9HYPH|nr:hypothetical protein MES5069_510016 [Mesorhizobium escarrei]
MGGGSPSAWSIGQCAGSIACPGPAQATCSGGGDSGLAGTSVFVVISVSIAVWLAFELLIALLLRTPRRQPANRPLIFEAIRKRMASCCRARPTALLSAASFSAEWRRRL